MGDFNTILTKEDRIGGNEIIKDLRELSSHLDECELHELKSVGAFFSWINKTIFSRIDKVFFNVYWYEVFDYTHSHYMLNGLSDHTPILIQFPTSPKLKPILQYCDM